MAIELVNAGANVNQPNDKGFTPLHVAAVSTNGALCLELLVNNGADVNYQVPKRMSRILIALRLQPCPRSSPGGFIHWSPGVVRSYQGLKTVVG